MIVKCVEELHVFQRSLRLADEITALLERPKFRRWRRLREQLENSSGAVPALIAEGFPLSTDRHFAQCLYRARSESSETRAHLAVAVGRGIISDSERNGWCARYNEIEKMLTGLIKHLEREDRKRRG